eukprot:1158554-Pelagomonas_calceolata.AAC.1
MVQSPGARGAEEGACCQGGKSTCQNGRQTLHEGGLSLVGLEGLQGAWRGGDPSLSERGGTAWDGLQE